MESKFKDVCIDFLIKFRYLLALFSLVLTGLLAFPAQNLFFEADYNIYFEDDEPHLLAHEEMQDIYTKSDNIAIIIKPENKDVFTKRNLSIIHEITELSWQTPYVIRVDSISNFQHTSADDDDLIVEDFVLDPKQLDTKRIEYIKAAALNEKSLVNRLVSENGATTIISVTVELPPSVDRSAELSVQAEQRLLRDVAEPEIVSFHRQILADYQQRYPDLEMHLGGVPVMTNTFSESALKDASTLTPLMYGVIILLLAVFLKSIGSVVGTVLLIACASSVGVASAAWFGYALNMVNITAPTIILTIAVCDSVHILVIYLRGLSAQLTPVEAMKESLRLNFQPIILTSITTAVGFLTLNFSISPPFQSFGNMTAVGVLWAMLLSFTLLPAVTILLVRKRKVASLKKVDFLQKYSRFIVCHHKAVFIFTILVAGVLIAFIPKNVIDDDPISYFKPGVDFRDASDFLIENLPGVKDVNFSVSCDTPGCINGVDFLNKISQFEAWLSAMPEVVYVSSYTDVVKRLNRSMNRDDQGFYKIPDNSDLSAQYNLLYEMSLPYGLDLNNQINIDKSAVRIAVLAERLTTGELIRLEERGREWLQKNYSSNVTPGASVSLMFAHLGVKNINSMLLGGIFAIIGVTLTILIAMRSLRYALISMIPNSIPALMAFGAWGLLVSQINMAVAGVFSISLGILVDDTVHFITKYRDGRFNRGLSPEEAIHHAFSRVGSALIITTIVLMVGFGMLLLSDFNLNSMMGLLTAITIGIALIFDFLILPSLLMMLDKDDKPKTELSL